VFPVGYGRAIAEQVQLPPLLLLLALLLNQSPLPVQPAHLALLIQLLLLALAAAPLLCQYCRLAQHLCQQCSLHPHTCLALPPPPLHSPRRTHLDTSGHLHRTLACTLQHTRSQACDLPLLLALGGVALVQLLLAQTTLSLLGHLPGSQLPGFCRLLMWRQLLPHTPHPLLLTRLHMWLGTGWGM
jgi:hypothetical protein